MLIHELECALNKIDPFQTEVCASELAGDLEISKALKNIVDIKSASAASGTPSPSPTMSAPYKTTRTRLRGDYRTKPPTSPSSRTR